MDLRKFAPFDAADYLDSEEAIAEYLSLAAADPDPGVSRLLWNLHNESNTERRKNIF